MAKTSSFATHFALFGQNTRRQTQMAYQQAAQDIQQTQASQLAQREMLVQMLKGEQDYLRALRKDLRDLDKSFTNLNVDDGLRFKLTNAAAQLGNVYANMSKEDLSSIQKTEERLEKRFTLDPSLKSAIQNWARAIDASTTIFRDNNANRESFNMQYGFDNTSSIAKPWLEVQKIFANLDNPDSKAVGLEAIAKIIENHSDGIFTLEDNTPVPTQITESLSNRLQFSDRLNSTQANAQKEAELETAEKKLDPRQRTASALNRRVRKYLKELDTLGEGNPEVQTRINTLKTNMENLSDEIAASKKLVTGYREQLQEAPAELPSIRERAGEILFQQDAAKAFAKQQANKEMRNAIESQSPEDEELLKYLSLAPDFKQDDPAAANREDNFFRKWVVSLDGNKEDPGTIQSYFANINKQKGLSAKQKDDYKTAATQRLIEAVNKQKAPVEAFDKAIKSEAIKAQAPEVKTPAVKPNTYVVRKGDTLGKIATQIGVSLEDLIKQNNIKNPNAIEIGQKLTWR